MKSGTLTVVVGLPGSGKSFWIKHNVPETCLKLDDFMANAHGNVLRVTYSRGYETLVSALRAGKDACVADISFCDQMFQVEFERVMRDAVVDLDLKWVYFEKNVEVCRRNIEHDARESGRDRNGRHFRLNELSKVYNPPTSTPVFDAAGGSP